MFPLIHSSSGVTVFSFSPQGIRLYNTYNKIQENQMKPPKPTDKSNHATLKSVQNLEGFLNVQKTPFVVQSMCITLPHNAVKTQPLSHICPPAPSPYSITMMKTRVWWQSSKLTMIHRTPTSEEGDESCKVAVEWMHDMLIRSLFLSCIFQPPHGTKLFVCSLFKTTTAVGKKTDRQKDLLAQRLWHRMTINCPNN